MVQPAARGAERVVDKTQEYVTGSVKMKLYKGNIIPAGMTSPCSLYSEELATFDASDYDQKDSKGFINLWGPAGYRSGAPRTGQAGQVKRF